MACILFLLDSPGLEGHIVHWTLKTVFVLFVVPGGFSKMLMERQSDDKMLMKEDCPDPECMSWAKTRKQDCRYILLKWVPIYL